MRIANVTGQKLDYEIKIDGSATGSVIRGSVAAADGCALDGSLPPVGPWRVEFFLSGSNEYVAGDTITDLSDFVILKSFADEYEIVVCKRVPTISTPRSSEPEIGDVVREKLREAGIPFDTESSLGGIEPDFIVRGPDGRLFVLGVKRRSPEEQDLARAIHQVELYESATGADKAFIVMPGAPNSTLENGVLSAENLVDVLRSEMSRPRAVEKRRRRMTPQKVSRSIFVAMPFDPKYDDVYFVAIAHAAKTLNAKALRVDKEHFTGDIARKLLDLIEGSVAVVVDLSEAKPNVLYEAGYAHALRKPAVHICSSPLQKLPFDVRNWNTCVVHCRPDTCTKAESY